METLTQWLPLILPLFVIQLVLIVIALRDLIRREKTRGPKSMWALIVLFISIIGPIAYLVFGREE